MTEIFCCVYGSFFIPAGMLLSTVIRKTVKVTQKCKGGKVVKDIKKFADTNLPLLGGPENVENVYHCFTRLRFKLYDHSKIQDGQIADTEGVLNTRHIGDTYAIVVDENVTGVCDEIQSRLGAPRPQEKSGQKKVQGKRLKTSPGGMLIAMLSGIMLPIIGSICGSGLCLGIQTMLQQFGIVEAGSAVDMLFTVLGNVSFTFLPIIVAASAADYFKANRTMAIAVICILMMPTWTDMMADGVTKIYLFDAVPLPVLDYSMTVVPPIIIVYCLAKFEHFLYKYVPSAVHLIVIPLLDLIVIGTLALVVIGPVAKAVNTGIADLYLYLYNLAPVPISAVFAAIYPFMVLVGVHAGLSPLMATLISMIGVDYIMGLQGAAHTAMAAAALAIFLKTKNKKLKSTASSAAIVTGIGLTEPGLYGVFLPFKKVRYVCMICSAICGGFFGFFKVGAIGQSLTPGGSIPLFMTDTFVYWVIGELFVAVSAFVLTFLFAYRDGDEQKLAAYRNTGAEEEKTME